MRAATPAVTGCRSGALLTGRIAGVTQNRRFVQSRPFARSLPRLQAPAGVQNVGFAQAPAQFKAPAGIPERESAARRRPTRPPTAPAGGCPLERSAISTLEPFGVPGLIYAAYYETDHSGIAGVDFFAWAVYDRI